MDPSTSNGGTSSDADIEALRVECERLSTRQKRLAELLNCQPEKVEHEIRNVLNELRLLRTLFESQEQK